jgi:hypothetical protein
MTDVPARSKMSEAIRALVSGRITNNEFENRLPESSDPCIREIFLHGIWHLYSDLNEHRLVGPHRPTDHARAGAARAVLFLKSGAEYAWPRESGFRAFVGIVLSLLTLGAFARVKRREFERAGDIAVWPFLTTARYQQALSSPPYLRGVGA